MQQNVKDWAGIKDFECKELWRCLPFTIDLDLEEIGFY